MTEDYLNTNFKGKYALADPVDIPIFRLSPDTFLPIRFDGRIGALLKYSIFLETKLFPAAIGLLDGDFSR